MTYILEINHINPTQDLFFQDTYKDSPNLHLQFREYIDPILKKHKTKGTWTNIDAFDTKSISRGPRGGTEWQRVTSIYHFIEIAGAVEFFKDLVADGTEFRRLLRAWHQTNGILNETNVLDEAGNIVEVIHACQAHKCIRFGACPSVGSGCATVPEHTHDGIYPIYHLDSVTPTK